VRLETMFRESPPPGETGQNGGKRDFILPVGFWGKGGKAAQKGEEGKPRGVGRKKGKI